MKLRIDLTIVPVLLFGLVACNLPDASKDAGAATAQIETLIAWEVEEAIAAVPMVSVSMATDCRTGPGQAYDLVRVGWRKCHSDG